MQPSNLTGASCWGCIHCQTFAHTRDLPHFPDAPRNSKQLRGASPLLHLTEKMESGENAANAGEQGAHSRHHLPHAHRILTLRSRQAKVRGTGTPFGAAKGTLGKRKKHLREGRRSSQPVATLAAQLAFLCQMPQGAPWTCVALEPWVMDTDGCIFLCSREGSSHPDSAFLSELCPPWDTGMGTGASLASALQGWSTNRPCQAAGRSEAPHTPHAAGAAVTPASELSCSPGIAGHAWNACPLGQPPRTLHHSRTCCCSVSAVRPRQDRAVS